MVADAILFTCLPTVIAYTETSEGIAVPFTIIVKVQSPLPEFIVDISMMSIVLGASNLSLKIQSTGIHWMFIKIFLP
jgi:hypothetical protein